MRRDRELILLALGSPREPEPKAALEIVLQALHHEAHTLAGEDLMDARPLALACRLEALAEFVTEFLAVKWAEGEAAQ